MVSHHAAKFGSHKHCGSGDRIFLVVEEQDLLKSGIKDMVWKHTVFYINKSNPGHKRRG